MSQAPTVEQAAPPAASARQASLSRRARALLPAGRTRRVVLLLALVWILSLFDLHFTILAARAGEFVELNPLARAILHSPAALSALKLLTLTTASAILLALRRHRAAEAALWAMCFLLAVLAARWSAYFTWLL